MVSSESIQWFSGCDPTVELVNHNLPVSVQTILHQAEMNLKILIPTLIIFGSIPSGLLIITEPFLGNFLYIFSPSLEKWHKHMLK